MKGNSLLRVLEVPLIRSIGICPIVFERVDRELRHIAQPPRDNGDHWRRGDGADDHAAIHLCLDELLPQAHVRITARQGRFPLVGQIPQLFDVVGRLDALRAVTVVPFDPWSAEEWLERGIPEGRKSRNGFEYSGASVTVPLVVTWMSWSLLAAIAR